ncbi:MAG: LPP20 family lipoprotein [Sphaerochaetaceae bacterium]|jgi:hypothetical protein|nr:LPP20 family lipoprotein [Sphaerochaetaceae bacterium]
MKKTILLVAAVIAAVCLVSCYSVKETDIEAVNSDGSPVWTAEVPQSNKYIYGVGSSHLLSAENSSNAADLKARADLARKLQLTLSDAAASYENEASGVAVAAYESLIVETVSLTVRGINVVQHWTAPDGTVWSLVSFKARDLEDLFEMAANDFDKKLEKQKLDIESKRLDLIKSLEAARSDQKSKETDEAISIANDVASKATSEIEKTQNAIDAEALLGSLSELLSNMGY